LISLSIVDLKKIMTDNLEEKEKYPDETSVTQQSNQVLAEPSLPVLKLKNMIPESKRSVTLLDIDGKTKHVYPAFSAFAIEDPDKALIMWNVLAEESGKESCIAIDSYTNSIFRASIPILVSLDVMLLVAGNLDKYYCMTCKSPLVSPQFCEACNFVAFCGQECADLGWTLGHSTICPLVKKTIEELVTK
jgi:hypothetical protein